MPRLETYQIDELDNRMGQTCLVDVDRHGKLDWISEFWHGDVRWFQYQQPDEIP